MGSSTSRGGAGASAANPRSRYQGENRYRTQLARNDALAGVAGAPSIADIIGGVGRNIGAPAQAAPTLRPAQGPGYAAPLPSGHQALADDIMRANQALGSAMPQYQAQGSALPSAPLYAPQPGVAQGSPLGGLPQYGSVGGIQNQTQRALASPTGGPSIADIIRQIRAAQGFR